jgi:hypothetical protein
LVQLCAAVVALADGLAAALADDCGNGVGSYPNDVQAASAARASAVTSPRLGAGRSSVLLDALGQSRPGQQRREQDCFLKLLIHGGGDLLND